METMRIMGFLLWLSHKQHSIFRRCTALPKCSLIAVNFHCSGNSKIIYILLMKSSLLNS